MIIMTPWKPHIHNRECDIGKGSCLCAVGLGVCAVNRGIVRVDGGKDLFVVEAKRQELNCSRRVSGYFT